LITLLIVIAVLFLALYLGWDSIEDVWDSIMGVNDFVNSEEVKDRISEGKNIVETVIENSNQGGN
jgi:hypothetical protein